MTDTPVSLHARMDEASSDEKLYAFGQTVLNHGLAPRHTPRPCSPGGQQNLSPPRSLQSDRQPATLDKSPLSLSQPPPSQLSFSSHTKLLTGQTVLSLPSNPRDGGTSHSSVGHVASKGSTFMPRVKPSTAAAKQKVSLQASTSRGLDALTYLGLCRTKSCPHLRTARTALRSWLNCANSSMLRSHL